MILLDWYWMEVEECETLCRSVGGASVRSPSSLHTALPGEAEAESMRATMLALKADPHGGRLLWDRLDCIYPLPVKNLWVNFQCLQWKIGRFHHQLATLGRAESFVQKTCGR